MDSAFVLFSIFIYVFSVFFFNDTPTTEIYTLSLHDALPICRHLGRTQKHASRCRALSLRGARTAPGDSAPLGQRSEEHTSELQSQFHLVCRLLLEKKKNNHKHDPHTTSASRVKSDSLTIYPP